MKQHKVTVKVGDLQSMANEFIDVWHQVEEGKIPKDAPLQKITFENESMLFKMLSPRRCDLLKIVHQHGKTTIRALAKLLKRDYSNVYQDVKMLSHVGLILKDSVDNTYYVPWAVIVTEISMRLAGHTNKGKIKS